LLREFPAGKLDRKIAKQFQIRLPTGNRPCGSFPQGNLTAKMRINYKLITDYIEEAAYMKKLVALILVLFFAVNLTGCAFGRIDKTKPVFKTENISSIILYVAPNTNYGIKVPDEYIEEITAWLGTFTIYKRADSNFQTSDTDRVFVRIEYKDGTFVENGLSTTKVKGITYYMKHEGVPRSYFELVDIVNEIAR